MDSLLINIHDRLIDPKDYQSVAFQLSEVRRLFNLHDNALKEKNNALKEKSFTIEIQQYRHDLELKNMQSVIEKQDSVIEKLEREKKAELVQLACSKDAEISKLTRSNSLMSIRCLIELTEDKIRALLPNFPKTATKDMVFHEVFRSTNTSLTRLRERLVEVVQLNSERVAIPALPRYICDIYKTLSKHVHGQFKLRSFSTINVANLETLSELEKDIMRSFSEFMNVPHDKEYDTDFCDLADRLCDDGAVRVLNKLPWPVTENTINHMRTNGSMKPTYYDDLPKELQCFLVESKIPHIGCEMLKTTFVKLYYLETEFKTLSRQQDVRERFDSLMSTWPIDGKKQVIKIDC